MNSVLNLRVVIDHAQDIPNAGLLAARAAQLLQEDLHTDRAPVVVQMKVQSAVIESKAIGGYGGFEITPSAEMRAAVGL